MVENPKIVLFLGAGASVEAGVPVTKDFVTKFEEDYKKKGKTPNITRILEMLKPPHYDLEHLMRLLQQISTLEGTPFENAVTLNDGIPKRNQIEEIKDNLKEFIQEKCYVKKEDVNYLKQLKQLVERYGKPLDIFSVNYDTAIEVFCSTRRIPMNNGFRRTWDPKIFSEEKTDAHINLMKIHGSVTWWQTEEGDIVEIPVVIKEATTQLYYGTNAKRFMIYPFETTKEVPIPALDMLPILRRKLETAKMVIVVGYSFRDGDIKEIFWDAARRNKDLTVVLISPDAYTIYKKELKEIRDGISSHLEGRVVCLPLEFERVFPNLADNVSDIMHGRNEYRRLIHSEVLRGKEVRIDPEWIGGTKHLARSGDFIAVLDILNDSVIVEWPITELLEIVSIAWIFSFLAGSEEETKFKDIMFVLYKKIIRGLNIELSGKNNIVFKVKTRSSNIKEHPAHIILSSVNNTVNLINHLIGIIIGTRIKSEFKNESTKRDMLESAIQESRLYELRDCLIRWTDKSNRAKLIKQWNDRIKAFDEKYYNDEDKGYPNESDDDYEFEEKRSYSEIFDDWIEDPAKLKVDEFSKLKKHIEWIEGASLSEKLGLKYYD